MASAIAEDIRAAYAELGREDLPVAVRSSANAEDLPGFSFAGQQETFLNVRGADALVNAVQKCWAALTAQAIGYQHQNGDSSGQCRDGCCRPGNGALLKSPEFCLLVTLPRVKDLS